MRRIVDHLLGLGCIGEILVWRNDPSVFLDLPSSVQIIDSERNVICHGRYLCAARARFPLIYVQDDDVLVEDIPQLLEHYLSDPERIHFNLSDWHFSRRIRSVYGESHSALVGWGAIFPKEWLSVLDRIPAPVLSSRLFEREADQYFTLMLRRHHVPHLGAITHLEGHSSDDQALWREPDHVRMRALSVREGLRLARSGHSSSLPPLWHVVVVCHNYAHYLREAVESMMMNDADYEITVVDDASTDNTAAVIGDLQSKYAHLRTIAEPVNVGPGRARNDGIASVDSAYVVMLDADDRLGPDYLFQAGRVLREGADIAVPDALLFGSEEGRWRVPGTTTLPMLLSHNTVHYCSAFRRSWWAEVGGFDEGLQGWEDYDFWIRVLAHGARVCAVEGDHFFYRIHNCSRTAANLPQEHRLRQDLTAKHRNLYDRLQVVI